MNVDAVNIEIAERKSCRMLEQVMNCNIIPLFIIFFRQFITEDIYNLFFDLQKSVIIEHTDARYNKCL